ILPESTSARQSFFFAQLVSRFRTRRTRRKYHRAIGSATVQRQRQSLDARPPPGLRETGRRSPPPPRRLGLRRWPSDQAKWTHFVTSGHVFRCQQLPTGDLFTK